MLIAEDNYEALLLERERAKTLYQNFREAHIKHHDTLREELDIQASDTYLYDVQKQYAGQLMAAKVALNEMQEQKQMSPKSNYEQSLKSLGHLINLPPLELKKFS